MSRIRLQIDELVLHGVPREQRYAVAEAMEAELSRLFEANEGSPALTASTEIPRLDLGTLQLPAGALPAELGRAVARQIHGGLR